MNKEEINKYMRNYYATEKGKASIDRAKKKYYATEKGKIKKSEGIKRHRATEKGKASNAKANKKYRQKDSNKVKIKARDIARRKIQSSFCSIEGCNKEGEKHHPDYNKPLEIVYLCSKHHKKEEKKIQNKKDLY